MEFLARKGTNLWSYVRLSNKTIICDIYNAYVENLYSHIGGRSTIGNVVRQSVYSCCIGEKSVLKPTSYIANIWLKHLANHVNEFFSLIYWHFGCGGCCFIHSRAASFSPFSIAECCWASNNRKTVQMAVYTVQDYTPWCYVSNEVGCLLEKPCYKTV